MVGKRWCVCLQSRVSRKKKRGGKDRLTNDILGAYYALLEFALDSWYIEVPDGAFVLVQDAARDPNQLCQLMLATDVDPRQMVEFSLVSHLEGGGEWGGGW